MANNQLALLPGARSAVSKLFEFTGSPLSLPSRRAAPLEGFHDRLLHNKFEDIADRLKSLHIPPSPAAMSVVAGNIVNLEKPLSEQLFDATSKVKILTSQIAMHFDREWRDRLFGQIDRLHDVEEWDEQDQPVNAESFSTFLKVICDLKPTVRPGLGLANRGYLLAAWITGKNRLTLQFLPRDRVKWVMSRSVDGELDQVAGDTSVRRIAGALAVHNVEEWFNNVEIRPAAS